MKAHQFNAKRHHHLLGELLRPIDLCDALLFCNHVLAAKRGLECHPRIKDFVEQSSLPLSPFLIHLAARQVLLKSLGESNRAMDFASFHKLVAMIWEQLDNDPAIQDPGWKTSDPTGWAIRYVGLQGQTAGILPQTFGLAVALFTNELKRGKDEAIDIPLRLVELLGMQPLEFMRAGFVAGAVRTVGHYGSKRAGTISTQVVQKWANEIGGGVAINWKRCLEFTACTRSDFVSISRRPTHTSQDLRYDIYSFNALRSHPMINVGEECFVAPDPHLVYARTSTGMYYDLLAADGEAFTRPFGYRFARLVHDLATSACGTGQIWSEELLSAEARNNPPSRNADHVFIGNTGLVLIECKALRPSVKLLMMGEPTETDDLANRVAGAVNQLTLHAHSIEAGKWRTLGLDKSPRYTGLVVTYGEIPTANGLLFRKKVARSPNAPVNPIPYLVISLAQFDSLMRLIEHGHDLDIAANALASDEDGFPGQYETDLWEDAVSTVTRRRGNQFLNSLPSEDALADH